MPKIQWCSALKSRNTTRQQKQLLKFLHKQTSQPGKAHVQTSEPIFISPPKNQRLFQWICNLDYPKQQAKFKSCNSVLSKAKNEKQPVKKQIKTLIQPCQFQLQQIKINGISHSRNHFTNQHFGIQLKIQSRSSLYVPGLQQTSRQQSKFPFKGKFANNYPKIDPK